eukprot:6209692-Pleurochrysis_carterae.AAC.1
MYATRTDNCTFCTGVRLARRAADQGVRTAACRAVVRGAAPHIDHSDAFGPQSLLPDIRRISAFMVDLGTRFCNLLQHWIAHTPSLASPATPAFSGQNANSITPSETQLRFREEGPDCPTRVQHRFQPTCVASTLRDLVLTRSGRAVNKNSTA